MSARAEKGLRCEHLGSRLARRSQQSNTGADFERLVSIVHEGMHYVGANDMMIEYVDPSDPMKTMREKAYGETLAKELARQRPAAARFNADNLGYFAAKLVP